LLRLARPDWDIALNPVQLALVQQVDGHRAIGEIVTAAKHSGVMPPLGQAELEQFGIRHLQALWRLDFLSIGLR
jgi:hypothetical protein